MSMPSCELSVLIRVRTESHSLADVLSRLSEQRVNASWEIIVLDNESDDDSAVIAAEAGARIFVLPRAMFGYGRAINVGVGRGGASVSIGHMHSRASEPDHPASLLRYRCWYGLGGLGEKPHGGWRDWKSGRPS
jgi:hypothetical protein